MSKPRRARLSVRTYQGERDIPAIAALYRAAARVDGPEFHVSDGEMRQVLTQPASTPGENAFLFEVGKKLVAFGRTHLQPGVQESVFELHGVVHPEWRRQGIGAQVMERVEQRIQELLPAIKTPVVHIGVNADLRHKGRHRIFAQMGYRPVRYFYDMERRLTRDGTWLDLPPPEPPQGVVIRSMAERSDLPAVWQAANEAFRGQWGYMESSPEQWQQWVDDPGYRPELWQVAWDAAQDRVAGLCLGGIDAEQNAMAGRTEGWIHVLAVCPPYRKRGLGRAVLLSGLAALQRAGAEWGLLSVDTDNPTGALRLYEGAGFRPAKTRVAYLKTVRL